MCAGPGPPGWGRYSQPPPGTCSGSRPAKETGRRWAEPGGAPGARKSRAGWSCGTDLCGYGASSLPAGHGPGPARILPPDSVPGRPRRAAEPEPHDRRTPEPVSQRPAGAEGCAGSCEQLQYGQQQPLLLPRHQNRRCILSGVVVVGHSGCGEGQGQGTGQAREPLARYQTQEGAKSIMTSSPFYEILKYR